MIDTKRLGRQLHGNYKAGITPDDVYLAEDIIGDSKSYLSGLPRLRINV